MKFNKQKQFGISLLIFSLLFILYFFWNGKEVLAGTISIYRCGNCGDCFSLCPQPPVASGNTCYNNLSSCTVAYRSCESGVSHPCCPRYGGYCDYYCGYSSQDPNKPSCSAYCSGDTRYYGSSPQCTSQGWGCSTYSSKNCNDYDFCSSLYACRRYDYECRDADCKTQDSGCAPEGCPYVVDNNCTNLCPSDGWVCYSDSAKAYRDCYCSGGSCKCDYSQITSCGTDFCSNLYECKRYDYYCDNGECKSQYVTDNSCENLCPSDGWVCLNESTKIYRNCYCSGGSCKCDYSNSTYCGDDFCSTVYACKKVDNYCSGGSCASQYVVDTSCNSLCGQNCNPNCPDKCCQRTCDSSGNCQDCTPPSCECTCTNWVNDSCGGNGCSSSQMHQTRTCTPTNCDITSRCVNDSCGSWTNVGCGVSPCASDKMKQTRTCTYNCLPTYQCVSDPSCGGGGPTQYTLSVSKSGNGSGTVTDSGINCGSDCSENYNSGTSVTLIATPASGSYFAGWSGDCSGTGSCTLTMNSNKSVTATFNLAGDCQSECQSRGYGSGNCRQVVIPNVFGTGSDGSVTFSSNSSINSDKNYTDMTINSGVTVTVANGVKIRVKGILTINGTLTGTAQGAASGQNGIATDQVGGKGGGGGSCPSYYGGSSGNYAGGGGGGASFSGSGGGGGSYSGGGGNSGGGRGGGVLKIYAHKLLIGNSGIISSNGADGGSGAGGGGGGRIYLYFGSEGFSNSGKIEAKGGKGGGGGTGPIGKGGGGGGGGGYVGIVGPFNVASGNVNVSGGVGGSGGTMCYGGSSGESGSMKTSIDPSLADSGGCQSGEVDIGQDNCSTGNICCCSGVLNQPPTASFSCDSSLCPGGDSANCIMYQPTSDINTCVFTLRNNSTDTDGQISKTKWYIKKKTEPDSSYREIGSCSGKCDHTIQITDVPDPAIYAVKLYVEDDKGASSTITRDLTVKREISAGFMCSLDNSNWKSCETIKVFPGQTIYVKDDPSLTEHSVPSEGANISSRTWQKGDGTNFETFSQNKSNATTTLTTNQKVIRLIVTDTASRSDRQDHQLSVTYPLPFWKEIPPIFFKMRDFFASLVLKFKLF